MVGGLHLPHATAALKGFPWGFARSTVSAIQASKSDVLCAYSGNINCESSCEALHEAGKAHPSATERPFQVRLLTVTSTLNTDVVDKQASKQSKAKQSKAKQSKAKQASNDHLNKRVLLFAGSSTLKLPI